MTVVMKHIVTVSAEDSLEQTPDGQHWVNIERRRGLLQEATMGLKRS